MITALLAAVVALAFTVEATVGFGATVVTVTLGAMVLPVEQLLPAFIPLNILVSSVILARNHGHVAWRLLAGRILPACGVGLAGGLALLALHPGEALRLGFGCFVVLLSLLELRATLTARPSARPLPAAAELAFLGAGGIIHGLFGAGGPLVVYVLGRRVADKSVFRATLAVLWLTLNLVLVGGYLTMGLETRATLGLSARLLPAMVLGLVVGDRLHHRLDGARFRLGLWALLLVAALALAGRSLAALLAR